MKANSAHSDNVSTTQGQTTTGISGVESSGLVKKILGNVSSLSGSETLSQLPVAAKTIETAAGTHSAKVVELSATKTTAADVKDAIIEAGFTPMGVNVFEAARVRLFTGSLEDQEIYLLYELDKLFIAEGDNVLGYTKE